MGQGIFIILQDLECILRGLNHLCNHINCVHSYMENIRILDLRIHLVSILNYLSSQCIKESPYTNQISLHTLNQEEKIDQSLPKRIYA